MFYTNVARYGKSILARGYNSKGVSFKRKVKFKPTLYTVSDQESEYKTMYGENLKPKKFDSMTAAGKHVQDFSDVHGYEIHGNTNYVTQFIQEYFSGKIEYDRKFIRVGNIDIEVYSDEGFPEPHAAAYPVTSIAYLDSKMDQYHVWGLKDFDVDATDYDVHFVKCESEVQLLAMFIAFIEDNPPDIITGWNCELFDIPYLVNRIVKLLSETDAKRLSPWGIVNYRQIWEHNKENDAYDIVGISIIDYMAIFKKFGYSYGPQESFSLDNICHAVLGERKLSYEEHGSLHKLWVNDPQKYFVYNIRDVDLVDRLDKETCLIDIVLSVAYKAGSNYKDTLGTVSVWDSIIYRKLMEDKIVVPFGESHEKVKYPGGYVKEPQLGMHKWVMSVDLASLYPNIIAQNNMSIETLVQDQFKYGPKDVDFYLNESNEIDLDDEHCICANGVPFRRGDPGVIPSIIIQYFDERKEVKKKMLECKQLKEKAKTEQEKIELDHQINLYDNQQMTIKILMNSLYGAMGNVYFRFYDLRIAEGITLTGQLAIKWAERAVNKAVNKLNGTEGVDYVIAIDTDSIYIRMDEMVQKFKPENPVDFLDDTYKKYLGEVINKAYDKLYHRLNSNLPRMDMDREVIADTAIWVAKKHYILNVLDNEGVRYTDPKLKIMGIQAVKSSTPKICRDALKESFRIIMQEDEETLKAYIKNFEKTFKASTVEDIAFPRGVNDIEKWMENSPVGYKKGVPIQVRGAISFNRTLKEKNLLNDFETIKSGNKVKFVYLKVPNPTQENVICFDQFVPKELGLNRYIDYKTQFEKSYKKTLRGVTDKLGWDIDTTANLVRYFYD